MYHIELKIIINIILYNSLHDDVKLVIAFNTMNN